MKVIKKSNAFIVFLLLAATFNSHQTHTMEQESTSKKISWVILAGAAIIGGYVAYKKFLSYIREEPPGPFAELPSDQQKAIIELLASNSGAKTLQEAAQIINSLAQVNKDLNTLINNPHFCLKIIMHLAQEFKLSEELVASTLHTDESIRRRALQKKLKDLCISHTGSIIGFISQQERDEFEKLLKENVDLNFTYSFSEDKAMPLLIKLVEGQHEMLVHFLKNGADINQTDSKGKTALMHTAQLNQVLIEIILIDNPNLLINQQDNKGCTALMYNLNIHPDPETIALLLGAGADPEIADNEGLTPLQKAQNSGNQKIINLIQEAIKAKKQLNLQRILFKLCATSVTTETSHQIQSLCKRGADLNFIYANNNMTLLMLAASENDCPMIKILLDNGADINMANVNGATALMIAVNYESTDAVQCLLNDPNIKINQQDKKGNTTLMLAISTKNKLIIKQLLDAGADSEIANNAGLTPRNATMHISIPKGYNPLAEDAPMRTVPIEIEADVEIQSLIHKAILKKRGAVNPFIEAQK